MPNVPPSSRDRGCGYEASSYESGGVTVNDDKLLARTTSDPRIFGGKPIIRGMRIPVELILSLLAQGARHEEIL